MAKQTSLFTFSGKAGNMIGYYRDGKHYFRSMPETVRQTTATRRAAQRFGAASSKGRLIRRAFANDLDVRCDGGHINRLNKTIIKGGIRNTEAIAGFRFNQHTGTDRFFTVAPTLSEDGILHIPPQALPQCRGISTLEVKVIATRIHFGERRVTGTETAMILLDIREAFAGAALNVDVPGKGTLIVALQVRGMCGDRASFNRKYLAADIIAVQEPQTKQVFHKPEHQQQAMLQQRLQSLAVTAQQQAISSTHQATQRQKMAASPPVIQRE
ncbi:hypothetical protein [Chitinophaga cymbidii]|uniref:Uncharacterized protein n=1 Tax=Chitinophaga cymbidii TaxID=1096750 RepID=A0A512RH53_9BACT|nr:hypothetical protein [Chitinophaga cymbidii]GEP95029.1 hypothetical protein CCY01nite_12890 [Chitinophaga cymbidii]